MHAIKWPRIAVIAAFAAAIFSSADAAEPVMGDDGLHKQPWFLDSFLDMGDDLAEAAEEGKGLIVLFEQRGCPYCAELHKVNFQRDEITDLIKAKYNVVQLDLWGSRETTDFDDEALEERALASKWGVNFTPTTVIFSADAAGAADVEEALRLPGYLRPFHYVSALEFVATGSYKSLGFQRFLQEKLAALEAQGIKPDVW